MSADLAPYCISCGDPPLLSYRGRRTARGPLCGRCIRELILLDQPGPRAHVPWRGEVSGDEPDQTSADGVVIDLRFAAPRLLPSLHDEVDDADEVVAAEDSEIVDLDAIAVNEGVDPVDDRATSGHPGGKAPKARRGRPLRAKG